MTLKSFEQTPASKLDYTIDYEKDLGVLNDTITASEWTAELPLAKVTESFQGFKCTVFLTGGDVGETYLVTNKIDTAAGRVYEKSFYLKIMEAVD